MAHCLERFSIIFVFFVVNFAYLEANANPRATCADAYEGQAIDFALAAGAAGDQDALDRARARFFAQVLPLFRSRFDSLVVDPSSFSGSRIRLRFGGTENASEIEALRLSVNERFHELLD